MDEYSYNPNRKLNIKKVILVISLLIAFFIWIFFSYIRTHTPDPEVKEETHTTVFYDAEQKIRLEIPNAYHLKQYTSDNPYLLELRSDRQLDIFVSSRDFVPEKDLYTIVSADKRAYIETFDSYSNLSELRELNVNGNLAYTYSFHYLDANTNTAFYLQVVWLQMEDAYYVFDIEFPLNDLNYYANIVTDTLSLFQKNTNSD